MLTRSFRQFQFAALGIVLLTVVTRLPSLLDPSPITDEAIYSVVANEIVDGGRPYVDAVDRKPPLLFWTYAAVFEAAGKFNWRALHAVALVWTLCTMAGLYMIGKRLFDCETGLIAALLYGVFQPWAISNNDNLAFNGELLINLPIVWAWAIAFGRGSSRARPELIAAGALLCAAFLLKQPAAVAAVPLGIYLLLPSYRASRSLTRTASVAHAAMLTGGFFGALGLVAMALREQGILREAFYWTLIHHSASHDVFWNQGIVRTLQFAGVCWPLILGAGMAYWNDRCVWADKTSERTALLGLLAASAIGAAAGGRFYHHYYIQLIPPLALLAAPHYARLWSGRTQPRNWLLRPRVTYAWLALAAAWFSIMHWHWRGLASRYEPCETARYLSEHSAPDDRVFVWGNKATIYLEARRRPACRYIHTVALTRHVFGEGFLHIDRILPGAWETLEQDFAKHPPAYIVDLQYSDSPQQYPVRDFPILARLLEERYRLVTRTAEGVIYRRL
jgi:4-amino-4-deoxy-L-arabinose transferase-like glycosyltransferase